MTIEFYTPVQEVKEWMIEFVRDAILKWHKQHNEISGAEVYFKEKLRSAIPGKICEINLSIFTDDTVITGTGKNFDHAARKAVTELNEAMAQRFKKISKPPDETISTAEI